MKNSKRITAVTLAVILTLSSISVYAEEVPETVTSSGIETSKMQEIVTGSGLETVSESAIEEVDKEKSKEDRFEDVNGVGEAEEYDTATEQQVEENPEEISLEEKEFLKEELRSDTEEKNYIILAEDESIAEDIEREYHDVTAEDIREAKEESAGDVQVVVSEMTGETAAEILDEDGVLCIEEDTELEGLIGESTEEEGVESTLAKSTEALPNDTWNLEMMHVDVPSEESLEEETQEDGNVRIAVLDSGIEGMSDVDTSGGVNFVDEEGSIWKI